MDQDQILLTLGKIAHIVSESLELRDVLQRVAIEAAILVPHDWMGIARIQPDGSLVLYSQTGEVAAPPQAVTLEDFSPALRPSTKGVTRIQDIRAIADASYFVDQAMIEREGRALITAPLRRGAQTIGFVGMESRRIGAFSEEHHRVLLSIADLLAMALEHERLWNLDQLRRGRLDAMDALLPVIANALDVREIFHQVSSIVRPVLPHDHLVLLSLNESQTLVHLDAYSGDYSEAMPQSSPLEEPQRFSAGERYQLIRDILDLGPQIIPRSHIARSLGIRSVLRIPIFLEGMPESNLNFLSRTVGQYEEEDVQVARRVADLLSLAMSHRRLAQEETRAAVLEKQVESLTAQLENTRGIRRIAGRSQVWKRALSEVARVAPTETTVLLTGESGTGKEVLARLIHRGSPRSKGPFVAINCAALPETLLESELFGHERGAFTGATSAHPGCLEQASGGILFLDEVGEMAPAVQAKVLRVLEHREFVRIGGTRAIHVDLRLVAATNRDLRAAISLGSFREDLYYRLRVFEISAPPLRERVEDIPLLAEAFLEEIGQAVGRPARGLSDEARDALLAYRWPGNARELRNVLERATILCDGGLIAPVHLPLEVSSPVPGGIRLSAPSTAVGPEPAANLMAAERALILAALEKVKGNRSATARLLGIPRSSLYSKLRKHRIEGTS